MSAHSIQTMPANSSPGKAVQAKGNSVKSTTGFQKLLEGLKTGVQASLHKLSQESVHLKGVKKSSGVEAAALLQTKKLTVKAEPVKLMLKQEKAELKEDLKVKAKKKDPKDPADQVKTDLVLQHQGLQTKQEFAVSLQDGESESVKLKAQGKKSLGLNESVASGNGLIGVNIAKSVVQHENLGRTDKAHSKEERSETKKVSVVDLRSPKTQRAKDSLADPTVQNQTVQDAQLKNSAPDSAQNETFQNMFQTAQDKTKVAESQNKTASQVSVRDAQTFQHFMNQQGNHQIADRTKIILLGENHGEIRMTLYPETLGKVRIKVNLKDGRLDTNIFVENQSVKDVFQQNLTNLAQSFKDAGWSDLSLQVSVGGDKKDPSGGQQGKDSQSAAQDYGRQVVQSSPVQNLGNRTIGLSDRLVNIQA